MDDILSKTVSLYQSSLGEDLVSLVLFGSRARKDGQDSSDHDLLLVAKNLPPRGLKRIEFVRKPLLSERLGSCSVFALTPQEVDRDITPLLLDISLDGIVLLDRNYIEPRLSRIKRILEKKGLRRRKIGDSFCWRWDNPPPPGRWEISWNDLTH